MDKQKLSILLAVIGVIGAVGGGSYALDFSNTQNTTTDNSQSTIINEGDTIINEAVQEFTDEIFDDFVDYGYDYFCEEVDPDAEECDEYWNDE